MLSCAPVKLRGAVYGFQVGRRSHGAVWLIAILCLHFITGTAYGPAVAFLTGSDHSVSLMLDGTHWSVLLAHETSSVRKLSLAAGDEADARIGPGPSDHDDHVFVLSDDDTLAAQTVGGAAEVTSIHSPVPAVVLPSEVSDRHHSRRFTRPPVLTTALLRTVVLLI